MKGEKNDCSGGLGGRRKDGFGHIEERASRVVQARVWTADILSSARFTPCLDYSSLWRTASALHSLFPFTLVFAFPTLFFPTMPRERPIRLALWDGTGSGPTDAPAVDRAASGPITGRRAPTGAGQSLAHVSIFQWLMSAGPC